jgi:hypothetical protein
MRRLALFILGSVLSLAAAPDPIRVLVWDERQPEQQKGYDGAFSVTPWPSTFPACQVYTLSLSGLTHPSRVWTTRPWLRPTS